MSLRPLLYLFLVLIAFAPGRQLDAVPAPPPLTAAPSAVPSAAKLGPGVVREEILAAGESQTYLLKLAQGRRWRVRVEQLGIDVMLVATWRGQKEPWRIDSPIDWDGTELLLLPESALGPVRLEVRRQGSRLIPVAEAGPYRIRVDAVDAGDAGHEDDADDRDLNLEALTLMTAAGRSWAAGGGEDRRRALALYLDAVDRWRRLRQPRLAAQSLYAAAVLHRLLGETAPALELARQVLPLWRALADAGREADTLNEIGLLETSTGRHAVARRALSEALEVQQRAGDLYRQVATNNNLCRTYNLQGLHGEARDCFGSALERARAAGDNENEAVILYNLGRASHLLGLPLDALDSYRHALELHRAAGRRKRVAETLANLAGLHRSMGEQEEALVLYLRALEIFRQMGAGRWEARTLHNLGGAYHALGNPQRALAFFRRALEMRRSLGDRAGEAVELRSLGKLELEAGQPAAAYDFYQLALAIEQAVGNLAGEGVTWNLLGEASAALGDSERALELFDSAISRLRQLDARPALASALGGKGKSLLAAGLAEEAVASLREALDLYRILGHRRGEAHILHLMAEAERATGNPARALVLVAEAIRGIESAQARLGDADLRATFAGAQRDVHELYIDLLVEQGATAQALEASERARAWGLLELLRQSGHEGVETNSPQLDVALRDARRQLHVQARRHRRAIDHQSASATTAEAEFLVAVAELERLEAEARQLHPEVYDLVHPQPPNAAQIRRLLDPRSVILEYSLGRERSFVFLVSSEQIRAYELPPRQQLEAAVRQLHSALASPHDDAAHGERQAAELSRLLLGPVLGEISSMPALERLVVVADGALHYLPFAALPLAGSSGADPVPVVNRWQIVHLPSAAALVAERQRRSKRPQASRSVAIFADPVFGRRDPRLLGVGQTPPKTPPATPPATPSPTMILRSADSLRLPRLRTSRREALLIAELAQGDRTPPGDALVALDFAADRNHVLDAELAQYRIVHFATHGLVDAQHPALSGLVLSLFDAKGRPRDGFLGLRDIYGLELSADLVVLSACRTALGKEVRGEGLVGLTRGFLHAGASRVLASLWPVADRATAELMERFYHGLFTTGLPPVAALRQAQLSMLAERRWRDPHNWAGFVLLGDWQTNSGTR